MNKAWVYAKGRGVCLLLPTMPTTTSTTTIHAIACIDLTASTRIMGRCIYAVNVCDAPSQQSTPLS